MNQNRGFTVIEILFALIILGIAVSIVIISLSKVNDSQVLDRSTVLVASILEEARSKTLSAQESSQYGVHLEDSQIVFFRGTSYSPSDPDNVVTEINPRVGVRDVNLVGGGSDVIFDRLTGQTSQPGILEVYLRASTTMENIIIIHPTGIIEPAI